MAYSNHLTIDTLKMFKKKCFDLQSAFQYAATQAYHGDVEDLDNEPTQVTEVILTNLYYLCKRV